MSEMNGTINGRVAHVAPGVYVDIYYAVEQSTSQGWVEQCRGYNQKQMKRHRKKLAKSAHYNGLKTRLVRVERTIEVLED